MSQANIATVGVTPASVTGTEIGVGKSWYRTESNGAGAGLAGVIGAAIADAILNAAPSARAHRQASEIAEVVTPTTLNDSLVAKIKAQNQSHGATSVAFQDVVVTQKSLAPNKLDDTLEITTTYTLSEDSSVLLVIANVSYENAKIPYHTSYSFTKGAPKSELSGPLYRNVFTYYSTPLPVPTLTPELKERLVVSAQDSARDPNGALPAESTREYNVMQREIALARDDKLTSGELSVFLTREWLKNDAAPLRLEIEKAHDFIAKYILLDINRTVTPSVQGADELLETTADDRTVRRIGPGVQAGSYVSSAANVSIPATFGNTVAIGKATSNYVKDLQRPKKGAVG